MTEVKEHFEVQHWTVADGWVNTWTTYDENDDESPTTYDTFKEAMDALDELFDEIEAEFVARIREDKYDDSDYRIVKCCIGCRGGQLSVSPICHQRQDE